MKKPKKHGNTRIHIKKVKKLTFDISITSTDSLWNTVGLFAKIINVSEKCSAIYEQKAPPKYLKNRRDTLSFKFSLRFSNKFSFFKFLDWCEENLVSKQSEEPSGSSD